MIIPHRDSIRKGYAMNVVIGSSMMVMRIMPYPPSFSSTAASTMEPAMGASTWAFGSQRCSPYRGIFTMNAIMHASHTSMLDQESFMGFAQYCSTSMFRVPVMFWVYVSTTRRGSDPTIV